MPENSDAPSVTPEKTATENTESIDELSEVVRRAKIEVAQLQEIQQRVTALSERIGRLTPPPTEGPEQPGESTEINP